MLQLQSALGIFALLAFAWLISEDRRAVSWRQAAIGLAVTVATAVILLKVPGVATAFAAINDAVEHVEHVAACDLMHGAPAPARQDMQSKQSFCFLR